MKLNDESERSKDGLISNGFETENSPDVDNEVKVMVMMICA